MASGTRSPNPPKPSKATKSPKVPKARKVPKAHKVPKGPKCSKCPNNAVLYIRYSGLHLCAKHLEEFILKRVKREVRKTPHIPRRGGKVAVALSGGKDSLALLKILHGIFVDCEGTELHAITVDEGIEGYRSSSIDIARGVCADLGIDLTIVSFEHEFGSTLDDIVAMEDSTRGELAPCTYCGVLRRWLLNREALDSGADVLATGHVLDDMAQSVLMNFMKGDISKLLRLAPHGRVLDGMVPRIVPLGRIPQKEVFVYAYQKKLPIHELECPYAVRAQRGLPLELISRAEDHTPGTRHAILRAWEEIVSIDRQVKRVEEKRDNNSRNKRGKETGEVNTKEGEGEKRRDNNYGDKRGKETGEVNTKEGEGEKRRDNNYGDKRGKETGEINIKKEGEKGEKGNREIRINKCPECGFPTSGKLCKACKLVQRIEELRETRGK